MGNKNSTPKEQPVKQEVAPQQSSASNKRKAEQDLVDPTANATTLRHVLSRLTPQQRVSLSKRKTTDRTTSQNIKRQKIALSQTGESNQVIPTKNNAVKTFSKIPEKECNSAITDSNYLYSKMDIRAKLIVLAALWNRQKKDMKNETDTIRKSAVRSEFIEEDYVPYDDKEDSCEILEWQSGFNVADRKEDKVAPKEQSARQAPLLEQIGTQQAVVSPAQTDSIIILSDSDDEDENDKPAPPTNNPLLFEVDKLAIYKDDLNCLGERRWLNDKVIKLHLNALKNKRDKKDEVYIFDSLFFDKLMSIKNSNEKHKEYYKRTARWFRNDDLLGKKMWIVPICQNNHWYIIAVKSPGWSKPRIIILDSLQKKTKSFYKLRKRIIRRFLNQMRKAQNTFRCRKAKSIMANIPQQTNNYDCGLFLLRSAALLTRKRNRFINTVKNHDTNNPNNPLYKQIPVPTRLEIRRMVNECMNQQQ